MVSLYEKVAMEHFEKVCKDDPSMAAYCVDVSTKLRAGFYELEIVNALGQYFMTPPISEVYSFLRLWNYIWDGSLAGCQIMIGDVPLPDKEIDGNNRILQQAGQYVNCEVEFWGGLSDDDGMVNINEPIKLSTMNDSPVAVWHGGEKSLSFPLEVGYQSWSKTLNRLHTRGLLARWPYHSEWLFLFKMRDEVLDTIHDSVYKRLFKHQPPPAATE